MTGAGFAAGPTEHGELRVEVRAVNGRGLSTKLRLPAVCIGYEAALEDLLRRHLQRGTVVLVVERSQQAANLPDPELVRQTADELTQLADALKLARPTLAEVLQIAGAGRGDVPTSRPLPAQFGALVEAALADLIEHRANDGAATVAAIEAVLAQFEQHLDEARERAPQLAERYRERLLQRVQEFLAAHAPQGSSPAADIVREVAIYADRVDVAEELQRLDTHLREFRQVLGRGGEVGRRLEFLLQELLRETNTMSAKSPDTAMTHAGVAMKTCIDRIKEQAANLQ